MADSELTTCNKAIAYKAITGVGAPGRRRGPHHKRNAPGCQRMGVSKSVPTRACVPGPISDWRERGARKGSVYSSLKLNISAARPNPRRASVRRFPPGALRRVPVSGRGCPCR
jgi:hypothetical protein